MKEILVINNDNVSSMKFKDFILNVLKENIYKNLTNN